MIQLPDWLDVAGHGYFVLLNMHNVKSKVYINAAMKYSKHLSGMLFMGSSFILLSLKMISANRRPDYCRCFSRNRDSVMISDKITDSLVSLLKVSYKNKISVSVESLYYCKENQKGRKRSERRTRYRIPAKTFKECSLESAGNSRVRAFTHE